jgi:chromosome segregation ATPase
MAWSERTKDCTQAGKWVWWVQESEADEKLAEADGAITILRQQLQSAEARLKDKDELIAILEKESDGWHSYWADDTTDLEARLAAAEKNWRNAEERVRAIAEELMKHVDDEKRIAALEAENARLKALFAATEKRDPTAAYLAERDVERANAPDVFPTAAKEIEKERKRKTNQSN